MERNEARTLIEEKMKELKDLCILNDIPMIAVAAYEQSGETEYDSEVFTPLEANISLSNDKITKFNAALSNRFYIKIVSSNYGEEINAELFGELMGE